jgi:hypothetical protein
VSIIEESATAARGDSESEQVVWRTPVDGLWVAETPTDFLGMVDRGRDGFIASGAAGQDLGVFATRADAQLAVYRRWFAASVPTRR